VINFHWFTLFRRFTVIGASTLGLYGESNRAVQTYASITAVASVKDIITVVISTYGNTILISLLTIGILIYYYEKDTDKIMDLEFSFYMLGISLMVMFSLIGLFTFIGPTRFFVYVQIMGIGILALFVHNEKNNKWVRVTIVVSLSLLLILSLINIFPSYPITKSSNRQTTTQQLNVVDWIYDHRKDQVNIDSVKLSPKRRWGGYLYDRPPDVDSGIPPSHFNYNGSKAYIVTSEVGRNFYPEAYPDYESYWRYTPRDYQDLEINHDTMKIYSNKDNDIFYHI
jgi:hypothetical protein